MQKLPDRPFIAPPSGLGPEGSINNAGCHVNYMGTLPQNATDEFDKIRVLALASESSILIPITQARSGRNHLQRSSLC
jgi:hypothetical protein